MRHGLYLPVPQDNGPGRRGVPRQLAAAAGEKWKRWLTTTLYSSSAADRSGWGASRRFPLPLKLSLKPGEKFVLNGAVVQNGDRRGVLVLQNKASVLREKDIMQPEEATTPARRIYFPVMMMYLDEGEAAKFYDEFALRLTEFMGAIRNPEVLSECVACSKYVLARQYYKALMGARKIVDYEDQRLGNVASSVQDGGDAG
jgi:flagellar protein FlbT